MGHQASLSMNREHLLHGLPGHTHLTCDVRLGISNVHQFDDQHTPLLRVFDCLKVVIHSSGTNLEQVLKLGLVFLGNKSRCHVTTLTTTGCQSQKVAVIELSSTGRGRSDV
jgi:hypothetical protein